MVTEGVDSCGGHEEIDPSAKVGIMISDLSKRFKVWMDTYNLKLYILMSTKWERFFAMTLTWHTFHYRYARIRFSTIIFHWGNWSCGNLPQLVRKILPLPLWNKFRWEFCPCDYHRRTFSLNNCGRLPWNVVDTYSQFTPAKKIFQCKSLTWKNTVGNFDTGLLCRLHAWVMQYKILKAVFSQRVIVYN